MMQSIAKALLLLVLSGVAQATTYYIASTGSDSNSGTSKTAPWAHLPGMATWGGSHTPTAGDTFIFRGCDSWGNANFPITWTWSGTSSNPITIDRDVTWYNTTSCPSGWNRPIFDAGGASINAPDCPSGSGSHWMLVFSSTQHVIWHWIEMKGLYWNNDQQSACFGSMGFIQNTASDYLIIDNFYFHDWTHGTSAGTTDSSNLIAYTAYGSAPYCFNCYLQNSVVNNSDGDGATCGSGFASCSGGGPRNWGNIINNVFSHMVNAVLTPIYQRPSTMTVSGNDISYLDKSFTTPSQSTPPHPNCIETTGVVSGSSGTAVLLVHDNHIHNIAVCEGMQVGNPNEDDYAWNNIFDLGASAVPGANGPQIPQGSSSGIFAFYNNTVRWATGCLVAGGHGTSFTSFTVKNNHCINDSSTVTSGSIPAGSVISNNLGMTNSTATSQGYTSSETYVFSPTASGNGTVGGGANLSSSCTGNLTSLCSDTTYAVSEQTIGGVVQVVASSRATIARGFSWDAGAYMYGTSYSFTIASTNGTVSGPNCSNGSYASGTSIGPCTATPNVGYAFAGWSGTGSASSASGTGTYSFTITSNSTLNAVFITAPSYTLMITATNGSVSGSNCSNGSYASGSPIGLCTAIPNAGYVFGGWSGTGSASGASGTGTYGFNITANSTLTASFSLGSYSFAITSAHGSVSGCTAGTYSGGAAIGPCTVTPAAGYVFTGWSGTGSASGASGTGAYSFNITANSTLTANYSPVSNPTGVAAPQNFFVTISELFLKDIAIDCQKERRCQPLRFF